MCRMSGSRTERVSTGVWRRREGGSEGGKEAPGPQFKTQKEKRGARKLVVGKLLRNNILFPLWSRKWGVEYILPYTNGWMEKSDRIRGWCHLSKYSRKDRCGQLRCHSQYNARRSSSKARVFVNRRSKSMHTHPELTLSYDQTNPQ